MKVVLKHVVRTKLDTYIYIYVTVNLYNQELWIITEFSVIMYNY
jgi:hypothetical protein